MTKITITEWDGHEKVLAVPNGWRCEGGALIINASTDPRGGRRVHIIPLSSFKSAVITQ